MIENTIANSICYPFFDKFEKGQKYRYGIRLKMNAASAAKGYKFAFNGNQNNEIKIKFKTSETDAGQEKTFIPGTYTGDDNHLFNYDNVARYSVTNDGYAVLLESIANFTAEQPIAGGGSGPASKLPKTKNHRKLLKLKRKKKKRKKKLL